MQLLSQEALLFENLILFMEGAALNAKKLSKNTTENEQEQSLEISNRQIELLARRLLPEIKKFFANEDTQREFEEWQEKRRKVG